MADPARARRLADRIQVVVAETLRTRVKDPRLGFVTVTDVRVTNDLQHATVFYTVLGGQEDLEGTAAALASARGLLRSEIGRQSGVRLTPTVEFVADAVPEAADRLDKLLVEARRRDEQIAAVAARAEFAGDEDPYRHPRDETADAAAAHGPDDGPDQVGAPAGAETGPAVQADRR
ncbi:MAG: 30S ribosome-binding factor RbfA [Kineosporiaceae bacterium]